MAKIADVTFTGQSGRKYKFGVYPARQRLKMSVESMSFQNVILKEIIHSYISVKRTPLRSGDWHITKNGSVQIRSEVM